MRTHFCDIDISIIVKIIYDIGEMFQIQDFDRFYNDPGSYCIQKVQLS